MVYYNNSKVAENSFWTQESWSVLRSGGMQWLKDESHREDALRKQMRNWERNKASKAVIESSRRRRNASAITGTLSNHWSPFWRYFYQFSFMFCLHGFFSVVVTFSFLNLVLCMDCEWERGFGFWRFKWIGDAWIWRVTSKTVGSCDQKYPIEDLRWWPDYKT